MCVGVLRTGVLLLFLQTNGQARAFSQPRIDGPAHPRDRAKRTEEFRAESRDRHDWTG